MESHNFTQTNTTGPEPANPTVQAVEDFISSTTSHLSTVMGAGQQLPGNFDRTAFIQQMVQLGPPPPADATPEQRGTYLGKLAQQVEQAAQKHAAASVQQAAELAQQGVTSDAEKLKQLATQAAAEQQSQLSAAAASAADKQPAVSEARKQAIERFSQQTQAVESLLAQTENQNIKIKASDLTLKSLETGAEPTTEQQERISALLKRRREAVEQKNYLQQELIEIFESSLRRKKSSGDLVDLEIPKDLQSGKGQQLIENMRAYLKGRADQYYAILPYLHRVMDDFDPATGTFWEPPARRGGFEHGGYNAINSHTRQIYAEQASQLYYVITHKIPAEVKSRIRSTYKYGIHEQKQNRCEEADGPAALFALLSLYKPIKATHRDQLTEEFNTAWTHFTKGDPVKKIKHLRPKLVEATQLGMHLNWSTTGKKIVQVLSQNDHVMAQEIKRFEKGPAQPEEANQHLQDLFAAIEAEAAKAKLVPTERKRPKTAIS